MQQFYRGAKTNEEKEFSKYHEKWKTRAYVLNLQMWEFSALLESITLHLSRIIFVIFYITNLNDGVST